MTRNIIPVRTVLATLLALFVAVQVSADFWDWFAPYQGPSKDIITLVVTSNYTKSRLLADLVQQGTRQPYLLFPNSENGKIFFIPYQGDAMEVPQSQVTKFINFLNPKRVIVIGDVKYVPQKYLDLIDPKQTVVVVYSQNWVSAAQTTGQMLNLTHLGDDFQELSNEIANGNLYKPDENGGDFTLKPVDAKQEDVVITDEKKAVSIEKNGVTAKVTEETLTIDESPVPVIDGGKPAKDEPIVVDKIEDAIVIEGGAPAKDDKKEPENFSGLDKKK